MTYSQAHKLAGFQQQAAVLAQAHPNLRAFPAGILANLHTIRAGTLAPTCRHSRLAWLLHLQSNLHTIPAGMGDSAINFTQLLTLSWGPGAEEPGDQAPG